MNRSSFVSKLFTPVITLLVLAYFGYQIYGYVSDPFSTTLAYTYQVEDTVDISGYVVRQEQVLTGDAGGLMRLRKNEGERIAKKHGGIEETITVRRLAYGVGVEKVFPLHSPSIEKIETVRTGFVRRAKLYYLRDRVGKAAKIREKL